jgi:hypothetical protein
MTTPGREARQVRVIVDVAILVEGIDDRVEYRHAAAVPAVEPPRASAVMRRASAAAVAAAAAVEAAVRGAATDYAPRAQT